MHVTDTVYTGAAVRPQYQATDTSEIDPKACSEPPKALAYREHSDTEWKRLVRGRPQAGVLAATSKRAVDVARARPVDAKRVGLGKRGAVVAGYLHKPTRFSTMSRDERFRMLRWVELARIADHRTRYGIPLDGDAWLRAMASVSNVETLSRWAWDFLPDIGPGEIEAAIDEAEQEKTRFTASELGDLIGLSVDERENIDIRTIRPAGMSRRAFAEYTRERTLETDRRRDEERRRAAGVEPRRKGESAKEEAEREGVSVATIYRNRRRAREKAAAEAACEAKLRQDDVIDMAEFRLSPVAALAPVLRDDATNAADPDQPRPVSTWFVAGFKPSAAQWRIPIVAANSDPAIARLGARVSAHAAAHRRASRVFAMMRRAA